MPNYLIPAHPAPPMTRTTRTPPPALPKKSASVSQVSGLFAGKSGSPSRYPHQRPQPGIPMPAGLKGPQMPGTRDHNAQWKNLQPGFNPQNVSFCFTILFLRKRLFLCKKTESLSWKEAARGKLNPLKQIFVIQIMELQRTHRGQIFEFLQGKTNWIFC